ncbi:hypothetical protein ZHAS_00022331 [Anopheles sinensis]|uniref:Uncharacterized protein n=1 Tax=Anopheles sinensis TaxID=74873 RepID=A0A084WUJ2_ANOSI|nr:hypothetical protein ZHAS_00022331 [Anopheles sinensis]
MNEELRDDQNQRLYRWISDNASSCGVLEKSSQHEPRHPRPVEYLGQKMALNSVPLVKDELDAKRRTFNHLLVVYYLSINGGITTGKS